MPVGTIDIKLRPIRLAFLLNPSDSVSLLDSIRVNSFLWGGSFNPIIPCYIRKPKLWGDKLLTSVSATDITVGYIKAFDPDFIVPVGNVKIERYNIPEKCIIEFKEILLNVSEDGTPSYGVGLFEILKHLYEKEFKFVRNQPLNLTFPKIDSSYHTFLSCFFGAVTESIDEIVKNNFDKYLNIKRPDVTINNYFEYFPSTELFPRRLTEEEITPLRINSFRDGKCVFLMDASSALDIIDYWNLRASGWNVLPIAKQISKENKIIEIVRKFIERNFIPHRHNPEMFHSTTILKSRSISESELSAFAKSLNIPKPEDIKRFKYSLQQWYPRIWDNWAREKDGVGQCKLEVKEEQHDLQTITEHTSISTLDPDFASRFGGHGTCRYANDVDIRIYGENGEPYAEVIPTGITHVAHSIGAIGFREWRISNKGLVHLPSHKNWKMTLSPPKAKIVMTSWFKSNGWDVEISPPGLIAYEMLKQLEGKWGIVILAKKGLIELLNKMSDGKPLLNNAFWGNIQRIANDDKYKLDPKGFLQRLTDLNIFRLGVDIQCPVCQQHSWYTLTDIDYKIKCPTCLNESNIPSHSPNDIKWSYRSFGAFSLPKQAYGVYTVLLTYYFFSRVLDGATTPLMSFLAKKDNIDIEADLAMYFQKSEFGKSKRELLFVECKTFNRFEKKDINRMKIISKEFSGCIIVFATLNSTLTKKEKELIRPFVSQGRKYWKEGKTCNPVLVLTSNELFTDISLSDTYKEKGGKHANFKNATYEFSRLRPLCDVSQQLYLDMDSWADWDHKQYEKKVNTLTTGTT
ncbi:MAG: hypothetical protein ACD_19C00318G0001, partial [uncultured bacterium]